MTTLELDSRTPADCAFAHRSRRAFSTRAIETLQERGEVVVLGPGQVGLAGSALEVYHYFESVFLEWARELGARQEQYPSLIPLATLVQAGYPESFPQHLTFASHFAGDVDAIERFAKYPIARRGEGLGRPDHVLAPAVCYHCYAAWRDHTLNGDAMILTAQGRCFRHEAPEANPLERLWDFSMREIVVIGSADEVEVKRQQLMGRVAEFVRSLGMEGRIERATDPFFTRASHGKRLLQRLKSLKFELRLPVETNGHSLAAASFNNHESFFGERFNIRQAGGDCAHSACIAFGLERWVCAFFCQFGVDTGAWPEPIRSFCEGD